MKFTLSTKGFCDIVDITSRVEEAIKKSGVKEGICLISSPGSTVGITTIEYEPRLLEDFKEFIEKIIPSQKKYQHDDSWGETNGFSHLRSSLFPPFLSIPIENKKALLGRWQQVVVIDFDNRPREREIIIKIFG